MQLRILGKSGLQVSVVGLGCNNFGGRTDLEASRKVIDKAIDAGITLFDTADVYGGRGGSEDILGKVLGDRRKKIVLGTKFALPMDDAKTMKGASRHYIMAAVEASLRRLKTDWIDLYQIHRFDPNTPLEETFRTLDDLVVQGKVRYIGCSNFTAWQAVDAVWTSKYHGLNTIVSCQEEYSMIIRDVEREMVPAMQAKGLGLLPYFPLASGFLTGKYKRNQPMPAGTRLATAKDYGTRYMTDANWDILDKLTAFATKNGRSMLDMAFSWLAAQPTVSSIIAGATKPEQIEQNVKAADWALTSADLAEIDKILGRSPQAA